MQKTVDSQRQDLVVSVPKEEVSVSYPGSGRAGEGIGPGGCVTYESH